MNLSNIYNSSPPFLCNISGGVSADELRKQILSSPKMDSGMVLSVSGELFPTLDSFYLFLERALNFPDYFGKNFAALRDCMNDGDVVKFEYLFLIVSNGDKFLANEIDDVLHGLLSTLNSIGEDWSIGGVWPWNKPPRPFRVFVDTGGDARYKEL